MTPPDTDTEDPAVDTDASNEEEQKQKLTLTVQVEEPSACQRHVTVTVAREDIDRYFNDQIDELLPKAEVPGFRKGRAPRQLVSNHFRRQLGDQVKGSLLMDSMAQASEEQDFSAISEPDLDYEAVKLPDDGPMTYEFDIEVRPEFEMPQWKGLKIDKPTREFTKKDIDQHLKNLLSRHGSLVPHDGPAEEDDYVTVNMTFRHEGKEISRADEQTIRLRPQLSFPDGTLKGFDKLMTGAVEGDKKEAKVKLSADSENEELRGQSIDIEFEVLDVKRLELPELTPEMLNQLGEFEDEGDLRDAVKSELERQLAYHQNQQVREQITGLLTESADWELPPELVKRQSGRELERMAMELQRSGFSNDQIQAYENELRQNSLKATETALKEHFILERIAEDEDIEDAPEDYDNEISLIALQQGESPRRIRARLEKRGLMDTLRNQIIERKVVDVITSQAKFNETKFKPPASDTEAVDHAIGGGHKESSIPEAKPGGGSAEELRQPVDRT